MGIRSFSYFICLICLLGFAPPADAFNCNVNVTNINFGNYDVFDAIPRDATGTISVDCNIPAKNPHAPLAVTIAISPGNSGTFAQRQMQGAGTVLNYNLYATPSFSNVWGDGSGGTYFPTTFITRNTPWTGTIYGRIPAQQNVTPGAYNDLLIVTVEW